jgi:hypothetical protein
MSFTNRKTKILSHLIFCQSVKLCFVFQTIELCFDRFPAILGQLPKIVNAEHVRLWPHSTSTNIALQFELIGKPIGMICFQIDNNITKLYKINSNHNCSFIF